MLKLTKHLLLPAIIWLATSFTAQAETIQGLCVRVSDGDTIAVKVEGKRLPEKIRLLGMDTPEVSHGRNDPGQEPWGTRAAEFTKKLCLNKMVRVESDIQPRDQYGRFLGYVYVGNTFVNLELVKAGHAMILTYAPNVKHTDEFVAAQRQAREAGRGLWSPSDKLSETPHEYRHNGHHHGNGDLSEAVRAENGKAAPHTSTNNSGSHRQNQRQPNQRFESPHAGGASTSGGGTSATVFMNTHSGKYHEPGCQYAKGRNIKEMPRAEAAKSGKPCGVCH